MPEADRIARAPSVSVVMPCFDAAATIVASIRSVLEQTCTDLELLVVDDGSSDGTPEKVEALATRDARIRLIRQANSGPSMARNRAVMEAQGGLVAFLDADDLWMPGHLACAIDRFAVDPGLGALFSGAGFIDPAGRAMHDGTRLMTTALRPEDLLFGNPAGTCSTIVVRRDVFCAVGMMRADMRFAEDQEWLFRVVCANHRVEGSGVCTVAYRVAAGSLSSATDKMLSGWAIFMDHAREISPDLVDRHRAAARSHIGLYCARQAWRTHQSVYVVAGHALRAFAASPGAFLQVIARRIVVPTARRAATPTAR